MQLMINKGKYEGKRKEKGVSDEGTKGKKRERGKKG